MLANLPYISNGYQNCDNGVQLFFFKLNFFFRYTQAPEDWKTDLEPFIFRQALISEYSILTNVSTDKEEILIRVHNC